MHSFGPKPHLLAKYHIGSAFIIHCIWPLFTFDLHEGHSHPKFASAALLTKFGSYRELFIIMTFDLCEGHNHPKLVSANLLTKLGSHRSLFTIFDLCWPLTSMNVIIILNLHQQLFWPNMVAITHTLPHLTSDDLWPLWKSSSILACISSSFDQIW